MNKAFFKVFDAKVCYEKSDCKSQLVIGGIE